MGLIEDYENLLASIKNLSSETPDLQEQSDLCEREIQDAKNRKAQLQMEKAQQSETLRLTRLRELTDEYCQKISIRQDEINNRLRALDASFQEQESKIKSDDYHSKFSAKYALLDKVQKTLDAYRCRQSIPPELEKVVTQALAGQNKYSDKQLQALIAQVEGSSTMMASDPDDTKTEVADKIIDFITFKTIKDTKWSNSSKFYCYLLYIAGLIALCFFAPLIPVAITGITIIICFFGYSNSSRTLLNFILPFSRLADGKEYLAGQIASKVSKLRETSLQEANKKYMQDKAPLRRQLSQLQEEYVQAPLKIKNTTSDADLQQSVNQRYTALLEECDKRIQSAESQIKRNAAFIANNQKRLPILKEKRKSMLLEIKDAYLNPKEAGSSKTLVKSFFLGIDDTQGGLIEFRYEGRTTLIIYKGATCRVNKDLISMMLMQILSSMSMSVLDIHLVDLKSAGTDYAVFFRKDLQERMHLYATDEDAKNAISILHDTLILRTQEVLTEAESLQLYNEKMLANKSLPMEYIFLFLQDPNLDQMKNQELQQLLYNGPTVGIIPIIFINHEDVNFIPDHSREEGERLAAFYQAFEGSVFIFDGAQSDLIQQNKILPTILSKIQKGTR